MPESSKLQLMDVTVSEGGFRVNHHLLTEQVADLVKELSYAKIQCVEVCNGIGIGSFRRGLPGLHDDKTLLQAAHQAAPNLTYCVYAPPIPQSLLELENLEPLFKIGRVKINWDEIEKGFDLIKKLKRSNKQAIAQILRIHLGSVNQIVEAAKKLEDQGADVIYLTDTFGSMGPEDIQGYFEAVQKKVQCSLGFHGRNNTGRVITNALAALEVGVEWFDTALLGMGRGAGTLPAEIFVSLLHLRGLAKDISLEALTNASAWHALPALRYLPMVTYMDLLFAKHKIDFYPAYLLERIAEILEIEPEEFILGLKKLRPSMVQLTDGDLREYLRRENLDLDVVLEYLKTGKIPGAAETSPPSP